MQAIDQDIFNLLDEQPTPSRGSVIVAKPTLADPHFKRSVVVLIDHDNEKGSMGLIVNKYTGFSLHDVLPSVDNASNVPLYLGGPVKPDMLFFLHRLTPDVIPGSLQVSKGLYLGGDYDAIKRYVASGQPVDGLLKCILGYAGWDQGQLGGEIERHDWAVLNHAHYDNLMRENGDKLWRHTVQDFGDKYRLWLNWPSNPACN
jgi:UPF0301 protein BDI_1431